MQPTRRRLLRAAAASASAGTVSYAAARSVGSMAARESDEGYDDPHEIATPTPPVDEIPPGGTGENFELVGHAPLHDEYQYVGDESFGIPRGSNGDITIAGDCVYVGSFVGYQPPLIVDLGEPTEPEVVGPVPDTVPGVGNGIEGIEASSDVLAIDHRRPIGELGFDVPEGEPERGLSVYDVGDPREPELVTRYEYDDLDVHALSLWRDSEDAERLLAVQSFTDEPNVAIVDLTGCPDGDCDPEIIAEWALETQVGIDEHTHEAVLSTDGRRMYVSQYDAGTFLLDSSNLVDTLRDDDGGVGDDGDDDEDSDDGDDYSADTGGCDPSAPESTPGSDHCLTLLNPDPNDRLDTSPPFTGELHHTALTVPDRPYLLATAESSGPNWDEDEGEIVPADCPGAFTRLLYVGADEYGEEQAVSTTDQPSGGEHHPETTGTFALPEQRQEYCDSDGWDTDEVALPGWLSPHHATVFPDIAFVTYYSAGLRAIDISNPFAPNEAGYFFNEPVEEVRWASYGIQGETAYREDDETEFGEDVDDELALRRPAPGPNHMFAFSFPVIHDGYVVYADVHSGLYVLEYDGPYADQIPDEGNCRSGNPGGVEPGYEPCPPYGETEQR